MKGIKLGWEKLDKEQGKKRRKLNRKMSFVKKGSMKQISDMGSVKKNNRWF